MENMQSGPQISGERSLSGLLARTFRDKTGYQEGIEIRQLLMAREKKENNKSLYQCRECGLHYAEKEWAEKCEALCKEHRRCNREITSHAEESKPVTFLSVPMSSTGRGTTPCVLLRPHCVLQRTAG